MKVLLFLCSESYALDQVSNRLSIFHVMDGLNSAAFPISIPGMALSSLWERDAQDPMIFRYDTVIMLDNQQIASFPSQIDFQGLNRARSVGTMHLCYPRPVALSFS
jgi:hypothetical protein